MRPGRLLLYALLLTPLTTVQRLPSQQQQSQQHPTQDLQKQIDAIAAQHHGKVALYAENMRTHDTVAITPDEPVQTASVIKLAILYEALEQVRAGRIHLEDKLTLTPADQVQGSGILTSLDTPLSLTLKDALTLMIVMSDNTATNLAIDHLGLAKINARTTALGLKNTYLYKKIFTPADPSTPMPADQPRFGLGKTTAHEMAILMNKFVTCDLGSPSMPADTALCAAALHMLHSQFYRDTIPRYLDTLPGATSTSIASKTGSLNAVRNDVAAISTSNGMVLLSIFTYDNADQSWTVDNEAELTIARLARAIIQAWSPTGLAPWPKPTPAN